MQQIRPDAVILCVCVCVLACVRACVLYNMELLMKNNATDGAGRCGCVCVCVIQHGTPDEEQCNRWERMGLYAVIVCYSIWNSLPKTTQMRDNS